MKIEIITPERIVHQLEGTEAVVPTASGVIGVRAGHIPLVAPIKAGEVTVKQAKSPDAHFAVAGGFVEVLPDVVRILADTAERPEEIDEAEIQAAMERARKMKAEAQSAHEQADAAALIEASLARLEVARRRKARGRVEISDSENSQTI